MRFCSSCSCLLLGNEIAFITKIEKWGKSQEAKVGYLLNNVLLSQYRGKLHSSMTSNIASRKVMMISHLVLEYLSIVVFLLGYL